MATKYRPYLTSQELDIVIASLKTSSSNVSLIRYLEDFAHKISRESIKPNLTLAPSLEDKLELASPAPRVSLAALKVAAYTKWCANPSKCSAQEIARVHMYRYENDLMDSAEEAEYEKKMDIGY
jgi:hypothetical protein